MKSRAYGQHFPLVIFPLFPLLSLKYAKSDHGRARAWIRLAMNEQSLQPYIVNLLGNKDILREFYEPHAFMRDEEQSSKLVALLASVSFTINFDM